MKKNIFVALFAVVCVALVVVSVTLVNCHRANVSLRKVVMLQANEISELGNNPHAESTIMYTGLRK
nr:MAG TPA: Camelysin metallo-endopeptidase [Caudoviricetes sp.]